MARSSRRKSASRAARLRRWRRPAWGAGAASCGWTRAPWGQPHAPTGCAVRCGAGGAGVQHAHGPLATLCVALLLSGEPCGAVQHALRPAWLLPLAPASPRSSPSHAQPAPFCAAPLPVRQGAADLTLEAAVVCSPPRMVKDTQQPLAPELREQLKW